MTEGTFNSSITPLDKSEVKRYAGLQNSAFDEKLIDHAIDEVKIYAEPNGIWRIYDYDPSTHTVMAKKPLKLVGKSITRHLANAEKIIFLAITIGEQIENVITDTFSGGEYALAVLMDAAATTAVEKIADDLERTLQPKATAKGYKMTWRFSPGYGDWSIKAQKKILPLTGGEEIGLSLTEGMMMTPRKSITAVIGLIPNNKTLCQDNNAHNCQSCDKTDCPARRK